jgi:hypothetical protein
MQLVVLWHPNKAVKNHRLAWEAQNSTPCQQIHCQTRRQTILDQTTGSAVRIPWQTADFETLELHSAPQFKRLSPLPAKK